jgi:hypothetical protein
MLFYRNRRCRQPARPRSPSCRLGIEALESRHLPSHFTLGTLTQVSGPSPFNGCPDQPAQYRNAETENSVAVDPTNPNHAVVAWFQDLADGIVSAATFDGGATWHESVVPGLALCSGGTYPTAANPWVTFASDGGSVYMASIENHFFEQSERGSAIRVNKSSDGGLSWGAPVTLIEDPNAGFFNDKPSITADPRDPNSVYVVWVRFSHSHFASARDQVYFTCTTDGGQTWEPARVIYTPGNDNSTVGDIVVVRPDGALLDFFEEELRHGNQVVFDLSAIQSTDGGVTWSSPERVATMQPTQVSDPENGQAVTTSGLPFPIFDVAQDQNTGKLYAVWEDARFSGGQHNGIAFTMSTDGGLTWSAPVLINQTPTIIASGNQNAFLPAITVAADGTVGVTYYDFRNNDSASPLWTDYWFVSGPAGADLSNPGNWNQELRLTDASFDLESAPLGPRGLFLGDYEGLAAAGNNFVSTWSMPHMNPDNSVDIASIFSRWIIADHSSSR